MEYITEVFLPLELLTVIPPSDHLQHFSALSPLSLIPLFFWVVSLLPYLFVQCTDRVGDIQVTCIHTYFLAVLYWEYPFTFWFT